MSWLFSEKYKPKTNYKILQPGIYNQNELLFYRLHFYIEIIFFKVYLVKKLMII